MRRVCLRARACIKGLRGPLIAKHRQAAAEWDKTRMWCAAAGTRRFVLAGAGALMRAALCWSIPPSQPAVRLNVLCVCACVCMFLCARFQGDMVVRDAIWA